MAQYEITSEIIPIDFENLDDFTERTLQNCKNLLMTRKGEIPFDRQRGLDPAIFDLPFHEMQAALMPELDRVLLWEPDAELVNAEAYMDRDGETRIRMVVEIGGTEDGE